MNAQTRYLATQTLFLTLYVVLFLGLHRLLLGSPRFRRFLEALGAGGQWIVVFPIVAALYFPIAALVFAISPVRSLPCTLFAGIGAFAVLIVKNIAYAVLPRKPALEVWDAAAFAVMLSAVASWLLGSQVVGSGLWVAWLVVNEALVGVAIIVSRQAFPLKEGSFANGPSAVEKGSKRRH
jgi:uncharacterized membrane protein